MNNSGPSGLKKFNITIDEIPDFAKKIVGEIGGGDVIFLYGELGAGKTTLAKAIGLELGVEKTITSPTFGLMNLYKVDGHKNIAELCHIDTYRIKDAREFDEIGVQEYVGRADVLTLVEWPEILEEYFGEGVGKRQTKGVLKNVVRVYIGSSS